MKKNYVLYSITLYNKVFYIILILLFSNFSAQLMGSNDDFDGDGIVNSVDLDDDNDGIFDSAEQSCIDTGNPLYKDYRPGVWGGSKGAGSYDNYNSSSGTYFAGYQDNGTETFSFTLTDLKPGVVNTLKYHYYTLNPQNPDANSVSLSVDGVVLQSFTTIANQSNPPSYTIDMGYKTVSFTPVGTTATVKVSWTTPINGQAGSDASFSEFQVNGETKIVCSDTDTDNDGIPNQFDLDSDGDGCPDAIEGNGSYLTGDLQSILSVNPSYSGGNTGVNYTGTSSIKIYSYLGNSSNAQGSPIANGIAAQQGIGTSQDKTINTCTDTDSDGIPNDIDLDDDNDGIVDALESPSCFYAGAEAVSNTTVKTSTLLQGTTVNSTAVTVGADIPSLHDGVITSVAASDHSIPANSLTSTSSVIYHIEYPTTVGLSSMSVVSPQANWGTGYTGILEGSIDGVNYEALSADISLADNTTPSSNIKIWPVTLNTTKLYNHYRIRVSTKGASSSLAFTPFEVNGTLNETSYIPSAHPKASCTEDTDGDGLLNHLDLDRDGDGCSDAIEGGANFTTTNLSNSSISGGNTGSSYNGNSSVPVIQNLGNTVGATPSTMGIPTIAGTGQTVNISNNKSYTECTDFDGDLISDYIDLDDDNDGVLDTIESPGCFTTTTQAVALFKITSGLTGLDDDQTDNDIQILHNGNTTTDVFRFSAGQSYNNANLFTLIYTTATQLSFIRIYKSGNWPASSAKLQGSNNGSSWVDLNSSGYVGLTGTTSPVTFSVTQNSASYLYYRLIGSGLSIDATVSVSEVETSIPLTYETKSVRTLGCLNDTDNDGIDNAYDLDSDGDGCPDAVEAGTSSKAGVNLLSGNIKNGSGGVVTSTTTNSQAVIDGSYGNNGFADILETATDSGIYNYSYTYANAINNAVANCFCYKPAITSGTALDTQVGITSLGRAGVISANWPMVRKGGWIALESKTKGFVPNRLTNSQISAIPIANLIIGMMVYNSDLDCLQINTDGTATGWKCFSTQTCP